MPGPTYEARATPDVQPSVDVPLSVTAQQLGAGVGQAVSNLGEVAEDIHLKEIQHANQTNVLDADNQQMAFIQQRLNDPKQGLLNQPLGKDAPGAADRMLADYDKETGRIAAGLTNEAQRVAFRNAVTARRFDLEKQLGDYEHKEIERHADEVDAGSRANAANAAVQAASVGDFAGIDDNKDHIRAVIADAGARKRIAPELIEAQQHEAISQTNMGVMEQLIAQGEDQVAKLWYNDHKDEFTANDKPQAARMIKAGSQAGESRRISNDIFDKAPDLATALDDLEARNIQDTAVYDKTRDRLKERFDDARRAGDLQQQDLLQEATLAVDADPFNPDSVSPALRVKLKPAYKRQLDLYRAAAAKGVPIETPFGTKYGMEQMIATDPVGFSQLDLRKYIGEVSKDDLEHWSKAQADIKKGNNALSAELGSRQEVLNRHLTEAGIVPAKGSKKMGADEKAFREQFDVALSAFQRQHGKEATAEDIGKIADRLLVSVTLAKPRTNAIARWFDEIDQDTYAHAFQVPEAYRPVAAVLQIPADKLARSRAALLAAGIRTPSDEQIVAHYNETLTEAYRSAP